MAWASSSARMICSVKFFEPTTMRRSRPVRQPGTSSRTQPLEPAMPTYAGGLGVLAGDTLRSAADLEVPMVGVTLLHRRGYFYQRLDQKGRQSEEPVAWSIDDFAEPLDPQVSVEIDGRRVSVRAWRYHVTGMSGHTVPVYLLDTDLAGNSPWRSEERRVGK